MLVLIWIALPNVSSILYMVHVPHRSPLKWFRLFTSPNTSQCFRAHPVWLHSCSVARSFISRLSSGYVLVEGSRAWPFLSNIWDSGLVVVLILRKVRDSNPRIVLTIAALAVQCFQPLSQPSNMSWSWFSRFRNQRASQQAGEKIIEKVLLTKDFSSALLF